MAKPKRIYLNADVALQGFFFGLKENVTRDKMSTMIARWQPSIPEEMREHLNLQVKQDL